ncbi:MAG: mandelate racemase/muconate lactonizing enzyme family protein [Phycisphaerae bacterium]|nr:mandelate racemase/muconate lactonizing enzyme family protein [Phycisphaerae bacterium]
MKCTRRSFAKSTLAAGMATSLGGCLPADQQRNTVSVQEAGEGRILHLDGLSSPLKIASIELLKKGSDHFILTRSTDGATGISVTNTRANYLYPILERLVIPCFVGKDARNLEQLIDDVYLYQSNYKMTNLALWCPVAWVEFSILDMLGKAAGKPLAELFGGRLRSEIAIYAASGNRHTTGAQEIDVLKKHVAETGARAVKFKVGGRMSNNADSIPGRSEDLVKRVRRELGDAVAIYADANGSYDAAHAIALGRLMEDHGIDMFEEPCPFDWLEETRDVAEALSIPVAGGEQEPSLRRFRWMIENRGVDIVQPDLHYNGGFIRAARVARMAAAAGLTVVPHMSGGGTGYVEVIHFASFTPNAGPFHEYKGSVEKSGTWYDPPLRLTDGKINVPDRPGLGMTLDSGYLKDAQKIV